MSDSTSEGKVALITGASRGIGRAVAVMAAELGYDFFLTGRDIKGLEQTADLLRKAAASTTSAGSFGLRRGADGGAAYWKICQNRMPPISCSPLSEPVTIALICW